MFLLEGPMQKPLWGAAPQRRRRPHLRDGAPLCSHPVRLGLGRAWGRPASRCILVCGAPCGLLNAVSGPHSRRFDSWRGFGGSLWPSGIQVSGRAELRNWLCTERARKAVSSCPPSCLAGLSGMPDPRGRGRAAKEPVTWPEVGRARARGPPGEWMILVCALGLSSGEAPPAPAARSPRPREGGAVSPSVPAQPCLGQGQWERLQLKVTGWLLEEVSAGQACIENRRGVQ